MQGCYTVVASEDNSFRCHAAGRHKRCGCLYYTSGRCAIARTISITDIDFNEARLWSVVDEGGTHLYVAVDFRYVNANGVSIRGSRTIELTGARKTTVATFFTNLKADILALEGI